VRYRPAGRAILRRGHAAATPCSAGSTGSDRLFFVNARYFKGRVREAIRAAPAPVSWLVFAEAVTHADSTGLDALRELTESLRRDGITLVVARLRTRMQEQLELAGLTKTIGRDRFPSVRAAVDAFAATGQDAE
jgi:anti-anti-sigma regulatory factor